MPFNGLGSNTLSPMGFDSSRLMYWSLCTEAIYIVVKHIKIIVTVHCRNIYRIKRAICTMKNVNFFECVCFEITVLDNSLWKVSWLLSISNEKRERALIDLMGRFLILVANQLHFSKYWQIKCISGILLLRFDKLRHL